MLTAVLNPVSGRETAAKRLPGLRDIAARLGRALEVVESEGPGGVVDAVRAAASSRPQALVLIGGDGSVGEACRAYAELEPALRPPVVLVPGGRGNSFYKAALSDAPWPDYFERALRAPDVHALDAARVAESGEVWALGCSLGFIHDSVRAAANLKGLGGRALYATVVEDVSTRRFAEVLGAASDGEHTALEEVHAFQGKRIELRSPDPMRFELDGTIAAVEGERVTCEVLPGVLPLAYPRWGWDDIAIPASR